MNNNRHIDPEDLTLFALQFLTPEQNSAVREHVAQCAICRDELANIQGDLTLVAVTTELQSPPALARDRLMQQVAREKKNVPTERRSLEATIFSSPSFSQILKQQAAPGTHSSASVASFNDSDRRSSLVTRVLPWAGWAVAAGLTFVIAQGTHERESLRNEILSVNHQIATVTVQSNEARRLMETLNDSSAQRVTLTLSKQSPVPQGKVTYIPAKGALVFVANNMEPLEPSKVYELWIIPAGGTAPVPAGTFHPDAGGNASVVMPKLPVGVTAKAFGITVEDEGGSQTPTMPIIMAGASGV